MTNSLCYQRLKHLRLAERLYSQAPPSNPKKQDDNWKTIDMVGPPDPVSNLRPVAFAKPQTETEVEKEFREAREATQEWNNKFWSEHNARFIAERKEFQSKLKAEGKESVTADEMSVFYKKFLDSNWKNHVNYNYSWYKQNIKILFLEVRVRLSKMKFK
ncbi:apoptogenic protein 1, mitochondrial [Diachasma alloeum]|uniref:apoptogenic protein 1, mitochondrial n=1 Tax=Diachasma alloeum TaxID=454923 RepID=UPI000738133B|nr:apoptogenic protein 1, mitochondrial [Diachasma alloeum]